MAFEKADFEKMYELQDRAEKGIIDKQMRPYMKWLTNRAEQIEKNRERLTRSNNENYQTGI